MTGIKHNPTYRVGIYTPLLGDKKAPETESVPVKEPHAILEKRVQILDGTKIQPAVMPFSSYFTWFECCRVSPLYTLQGAITAGTHGVVYRALNLKRMPVVLKVVRKHELNAIRMYGDLQDVLNIYPPEAAKLPSSLQKKLKLTKFTFQSPGEHYRAILTVMRESKKAPVRELCNEKEFEQDVSKRSQLIADALDIADTPLQKKDVRAIRSAIKKTWPITLAVMPNLGESLDACLKMKYRVTCFSFAGEINPYTKESWETRQQKKLYGIFKIAEEVTIGLIRLRNRVLEKKADRYFTHGDLKQHNCLVSGTKITVVDYDSIRSWNEAKHKNRFHYAYSPTGTPGFLAPELREGRRFIVRHTEDGNEEYLYTPHDYMSLEDVLADERHYDRLTFKGVRSLYFAPLKPVSSEYEPGKPMGISDASNGFPIQRRNEQTDIYALGCMFYEMVMADKVALSEIEPEAGAMWRPSKLAVFHPSRKASVSDSPLDDSTVDIQFSRADTLSHASHYFKELGVPDRFWTKLLPRMLAADPRQRLSNFEQVQHEIQRCMKIIGKRSLSKGHRHSSSDCLSKAVLPPAMPVSSAIPIVPYSAGKPPLPVVIPPPPPLYLQSSGRYDPTTTLSVASSTTFRTAHPDSHDRVEGPSTPPHYSVIPSSM